MTSHLAKWQRELDVFGMMNNAFVLSGNISDFIPIYEGEQLVRLSSLPQYLAARMMRQGFRQILVYDPSLGFYDLQKAPQESAALRELETLLEKESSATRSSGRDTPGFLYQVHRRENGSYLVPSCQADAAQMIRLLLCGSNQPTAVILRFTSQFAARPDDLSEDERQIFLHLRGAIEGAKRLHAALPDANNSDRNPILQNRLFLLADKLNDLPAWFYLSFPMLKQLYLEKPDYRERELFIRNMANYFSGYETADSKARKNFLDHFVGQTEGLTFMDLNQIRMIAQGQHLPFEQVDRAIRLYRHGIYENPWSALRKDDLSDLEQSIASRVQGQPAVVRQTVDILKRAIMGMSGLQHSSADARPRGVLFLAGPTGTGKTELAKAITQRIFMDERNMIRFDMSEYRQEQSDQRLLGAPPGYVGYEAGGQLTNAVREHPFSVLLFDEIEKAHPSLLDKFLQILDDGRITDGHGDTVYFQDCLIIFTSNLGINRPSPTEPGKFIPNISFSDHPSYATVRETVLQGVRSYFRDTLGRPELLNRIGNNILVFDFIRKETMQGILNKQVEGICRRMAEEQQIRITLEPAAQQKLTAFGEAQLDLEQGGRGIGNMVEEKLLNPLARYLFDRKIQPGQGVIIHDIMTDAEGLPFLRADRS